ncbi:MAG: hypothetical protein LBU80_01115 [Rikenellaceae bacterium]|jgi:hypothetical protein|nr:hypothetical protein [Rikenellaceae bacterium]
MKIVYRAGNRQSFSEMNGEAQEAVKTAVALVEGKAGFKTHSEAWWDCELVVVMGHNIYTTSITILPTAAAMKRRGNNWHNGSAYFCNGAFWANVSRQKVEII